MLTNFKLYDPFNNNRTGYGYRLYTMSNETVNKTEPGGSESKPRKSPIPQQYDRILAGALKLTLQDRVGLRDKLSESITTEMDLLESQFNTAKKLVNGGA